MMGSYQTSSQNLDLDLDQTGTIQSTNRYHTGLAKNDSMLQQKIKKINAASTSSMAKFKAHVSPHTSLNLHNLKGKRGSSKMLK